MRIFILMDKRTLYYLLVVMMTLNSCGSSQNTITKKGNVAEELDEKNRTNFTLLERISKMPGIVSRNGVPVLSKTSNSFSNQGRQEPLYILDGYEIGTSFASVNEAVDSFNVKKIRILTSAEAGMYGSRASNGVIIITTYK
ncbi:TonB-dependent receptor [Maribacter sp. MAR_2009_72]|uniref:TonB-dependent receptor n=1 Tax=Maribacter sp. MAR_2009_72 TaxID=1250050 RepID=UPI00119A8247|nr:TonB-dependent receptor plug domain-containing protein [Maribacter sp. MAR_2009_72]TVZ16392.1 TonB-dependent SusC/RagA subfamily outer membrane receptor [Maribacter sp. MAR_2009_72]